MVAFYVASNNKKGYSNKLSKQMYCNQYHCESRANQLIAIDCTANQLTDFCIMGNIER